MCINHIQRVSKSLDISATVADLRWSVLMGEQFKKNKYILALKKQLKPMINQSLF